MEREYENEIVGYLRLQEVVSQLKPYTKHNESVVNEDVHAIIADWVLDVAEESPFGMHVYYMAMDLFDRFLSEVDVRLDRLQLVSLGCLHVATKYFDIYPLGAKYLSQMSDGIAAKADVIHMEGAVLDALKFEVSHPTCYYFYQLFAQRGEMSAHTVAVGEYILCITRYTKKMNGYLPSLRAGCALFLARAMTMCTHVDHSPWTKKCVDATGYTSNDLEGCAKVMMTCYNETIEPASGPRAGSKIKLSAYQRLLNAAARLKPAVAVCSL